MPRKDAAELEPLQQRLASSTGKRYWRSLEELADTEEFRRWVGREFPDQAADWANVTSRRQFLKFMAASMALAGLQGCRQQPDELLVPYVEAPERIIPGVPLLFASAMPMSGDAVGVLVESHMGRPTMLEGNLQHPACSNPEYPPISAPAGIFAQASLLQLYDPDRSQTVLREGEISTFAAFLATIGPRLAAARATGGRGLRILTETITSPTMAWQLESLLEMFPEARWYQWEPVHRNNEWEGAELAFGQMVDSIYHFDRADVILSLDTDFLGAGEGRQLRYSRDFAVTRRVRQETLAEGMSRLYVVETTTTLTGTRADHRLPMTPGEVEAFARVLASRLGVEVGEVPPLPSNVPEEWLDALVDDLRTYRRPGGDGASLIVAGRGQSPAVQALAHAMNDALGNVGTTVRYIEPVAARPVNQVEDLTDLVNELNAGEVETLVIIGGNPVFNAPPDLDFAEAIRKAPFRVHTSLFIDETSTSCNWHIPETHWLEAWTDTRTFDGTASIVQPLIEPLYSNVSPHTLLAALMGETAEPYDLVRAFWRRWLEAENGELSNREFEIFWRTAVHDGVVPDTQLPEADVSLREGWADDLPAPPEPREAGGGLIVVDVVFRPDPTIYDGRFANNGWLQELPKPISKLTWDNAALISPAFAEEWEIATGDMVQLEHDGRRVNIAAFVMAGHPDGVVTLYFGYGRDRVGRVGEGAGFNVYPLRTASDQWSARGVVLRRTRQRYELAATQLHFSMEGRPLVQDGTLAQWRVDPQHPEFVDAHHQGALTTLYPEYEYDTYKWAMSIDTTTCIGCGACTLACQAENNIPVVGKDQVSRGREMHWIRVDHYFEGEPDNPPIHNMPVPCMHCEKAPCEVVCPVNATVHDNEGLNEMIYNRCIGTRYCSNNCPYKVRRFNFYFYSDTDAPTLKMLHNPDVTVRGRGVMEKCTYCIQRISAARIEIEKERVKTGNHELRIPDGRVATACQAACPTEAIVFGDLNDPESRVAALKKEPINYALLEELGTQPRTTYMAEIRNPNPNLLALAEPAPRH